MQAMVKEYIDCHAQCGTRSGVHREVVVKCEEGRKESGVKNYLNSLVGSRTGG